MLLVLRVWRIIFLVMLAFCTINVWARGLVLIIGKVYFAMWTTFMFLILHFQLCHLSVRLLRLMLNRGIVVPIMYPISIFRALFNMMPLVESILVHVLGCVLDAKWPSSQFYHFRPIGMYLVQYLISCLMIFRVLYLCHQYLDTYIMWELRWRFFSLHLGLFH